MAIGIRAKYIVLIPTQSTDVPVGSLFLDSATEIFNLKTLAGQVNEIGSSDGYFTKQMQAAGEIPLRAPVSKRADGKIVAADSDLADGQQPIGYALEAAEADGDVINVLTVGANLIGALTGLGFMPGQQIYLSENGGYTNNPANFTGDNDSVIKLGVADCPSGVASAVATDLIVFTEVIVRP